MLIKSFDGNSFGTDYAVTILDGRAIVLPGIAVQMARRIGRHPLMSGIEREGRQFPLGIAIEGTSEAALRTQLMQWLDPEDEEAKKLIATDDDGSSNERYLYCLCEALQPMQGKGGIIPRLYVASMRVDGDVRWRSEDLVEESAWNITASGQTKVVNNQGEDDAYPVITIEPTSAKTSGNGFEYKRWCPIVWEATSGATRYPIRLGPVNLTGKAQADGDDIRVYVDGVEVDRWLAGTLISAVTVWVNLDFEARTVGEVATAIPATGDVEEIESSLDISDFPSSGILLIESEAFVYTGKSNIEQTFTGVTRAAKGTSMAAHAVGTTIQWVQHDVWLYYGDSSLSAPSTDDTYKPVFDLDASSNTVRDYDPTQSKCDGFGTNAGNRPGTWVYVDVYEQPSYDRLANEYTANHNTDADPWEEIGIEIDPNDLISPTIKGRWYFSNPCGIVSANFQSGDYYLDEKDSRNGEWKIVSYQSSWTTEYSEDISTLTDDGAWHDSALSRNETLTANSTGVGLQVEYGAVAGEFFRVEFEDVVVTLDSTYTPDVSVNSEQSNYPLAATITNQTTGKAIALSFGMELNEELEVDTAQKTVTYLADGSGQQQALDTGGIRKDWLALQPGNNTLRYDETGVQGVTVDIAYRKRYYT